MTWWKCKPSQETKELEAAASTLNVARDMRKTALRQVVELLEKIPVDTAIEDIGKTIGKRGPP